MACYTQIVCNEEVKDMLPPTYVLRLGGREAILYAYDVAILSELLPKGEPHLIELEERRCVTIPACEFTRFKRLVDMIKVDALGTKPYSRAWNHPEVGKCTEQGLVTGLRKWLNECAQERKQA